MTPEQAEKLGAYLRQKRETTGLSQSEIARRAGLAQAQVNRLEAGQVLRPRPELLAVYADVLDVPLSSLMKRAGYPVKQELPTLRPYLRAKYRDLTAEDAAKVEAFVNDLMREHNNGGPKPGEDEA